MMWIIWALIIGFIVGGLARLIMPGRDPMGCFMTALLGIGGSILGGFIAQLIWRESGSGIRPGNFLLSLLGAIILLFIWRQIQRK